MSARVVALVLTLLVRPATMLTTTATLPARFRPRNRDERRALEC